MKLDECPNAMKCYDYHHNNCDGCACLISYLRGRNQGSDKAIRRVSFIACSIIEDELPYIRDDLIIDIETKIVEALKKEAKDDRS